MKLLQVALAASLLATRPVQAAIITDGTMGASMTLQGASMTLQGASTTLQGASTINYNVPSTLGRTQGNNLFHSFSSFDLSSRESATFGGPASIQNIISRVTGGQASSIDGRISSPNGANLFLVNPSGIVFGPNATLDISGSFYATTADYLQFGPVRFDATATVPANFDLAVARPSAFGFLGPKPASISVTDSSLSARTITFVGGDVTITRKNTNSGNLLSSPGGLDLVSVGSAGVAKVSDAGIDTSDFSKMGTAKISGGRAQKVPDIATSTGRIFISAGSFIVDGAYLASGKDNENGSGGDIVIKARESVKLSGGSKIRTEGNNAGNISIDAAKATVTVDDATVSVGGTGTENAGELTVSASSVGITNKGSISTYFKGKGGNINITASGSIAVCGSEKGGSRITSNGPTSAGAEGAGNITLIAPTVKLDKGGVVEVVSGGNLQITSAKELALTGPNSFISTGVGSVKIDTGTLTMSKSQITAQASGIGNGEGIYIKARKGVYLSDESRISTGGQNAGKVTIDAAKATVTVDGSYIYVGNWSGTNNAVNTILAEDVKILNGGRISSISNESKAGDMKITATGQLTVSGSGSAIRSQSLGSHDAGNINVSASTVLLDSGGAIETLVGDEENPGRTTGNGGSIDVHANVLQLVHGGQIKSDAKQQSQGKGGGITVAATERIAISGRSGATASGITTDTAGTGDAGSILVTAPSLSITDGGRISANSSDTGKTAGNAGSIDLNIKNLLYLDAGSITTAAANATGGNISIDAILADLRNGEISTSVDGDKGNGGNISLAADSVVLDHNHIKADAKGGNGGNVHITATAFFADPDPESLVTASSEKGLPGTVDISAPLVDVSGNLVLLPEGMLKDDDLAPRTCAVSDDSSSSFIVGSSRLQSRPQPNLMAF